MFSRLNRLSVCKEDNIDIIQPKLISFIGRVFFDSINARNMSKINNLKCIYELAFFSLHKAPLLKKQSFG